MAAQTLQALRSEPPVGEVAPASSRYVRDDPGCVPYLAGLLGHVRIPERMDFIAKPDCGRLEMATGPRALSLDTGKPVR